MLTPTEIIPVGKISAYLAANDVSKATLFGRKLDEQLPLKIAMTTAAVEWMNGQNTNYATLQASVNFLYALCGKYALRAQYIINIGISGTVVTPITPKANTYKIQLKDITGSDFSNATDYVDGTLDALNFDLFDNLIPKFLNRPSEWDYLSGGGFRILRSGFNATTQSVDIRLFVKGEIVAQNFSGKTYSLSSDAFIIPNLTAGSNNEVRTITIIPNGHTYDWDTNFDFNDSYPKQPDTIAAGTIQIYTFQYKNEKNKDVCIGQSLNSAYP